MSKPTASDYFKDDVSDPAMALITIACTAFPVAWPVAKLIYSNQCDPISMINGGLSWLDVYDTVGSAKREAASTTNGVAGDAWSGDDREAFGAHFSAFQAQLLADQGVAIATGTTIVVVGTALMMLMVACLVVAFWLAVLALDYWQAVLGSETGVGAAEAVAIEFEADDFANSAYNTLNKMNDVIELVSRLGAGVISEMLAANAAGQALTGNVDGVLDDLVQTVVCGSLDTAAGLSSKAEQDVTARSLDDGGSQPVNNGNWGGMFYADGTTATSEETDRVGEAVYGKNAWDHGGSAWLDRYRQIFGAQHA